MFRELKSAKGVMSNEQTVWLLTLNEAGADAKVWRPSDYEEIEQTLTQTDVAAGG